MRRLSIIVFVCLQVASCAAWRNVPAAQESTADSHSVCIDTAFLRREVEQILAQTISTVRVQDRTVDVEITNERYSAPDSSGKVYPAEKSVVKFRSRSNSQDSTAVNVNSGVSAKEEKCEASSREVEQSFKEVSTPVPEAARVRRSSGFVNRLALIGFAAVLIVILLVLKKFRVL